MGVRVVVLQQASITPSFVGQQLPLSLAHSECAEHKDKAVGCVGEGVEALVAAAVAGRNSLRLTQSTVFTLGHPPKPAEADGHVTPPGQHWSPAHCTAWLVIPGQETLAPTSHAPSIPGADTDPCMCWAAPLVVLTAVLVSGCLAAILIITKETTATTAAISKPMNDARMRLFRQEVLSAQRRWLQEVAPRLASCISQAWRKLVSGTSKGFVCRPT